MRTLAPRPSPFPAERPGMRALRVPALGALTAIAAACSAVPISFPPPTTGTGSPPPGAPTESGTSQAVVQYTNQARAERGLPALRVSERLMQAALIHANQMADAQQQAHTIAGARYPTLDHRLQAVGYQYLAAAENIAWNQRTAQEVVAGWMNSSGHRRNILDPNLTEMGAAVARSSRGEPYWIQVFGRPR